MKLFLNLIEFDLPNFLNNGPGPQDLLGFYNTHKVGYYGKLSSIEFLSISDIYNQAREILFLKNQMNDFLSSVTRQTVEKIEQDTYRDNFMSPTECVEYGLIDKVIHRIN